MKKYKELAQKAKVEIGWVWLYENGFAHRVPKEIIKKIEEVKEE